MHLMFSIQQVAAAALCFTLCSQALATGSRESCNAEPRRTALHLTVTSSEDRGRYPTFLVRLDNRGVGCFPVLIDPTFLPRSSSVRPPITIEARVVRPDGDVVARPDISVVESAATVDDFVLLDCNRSFGMFVDLNQGGWRVDLEKGEYEIRFHGEIRVRAFLKERPKLLESLAKRLRMSPARVLEISPDDVLTAAPVPLKVR